ncbi:MAG: HD domain-containing protein [Lachnospiraceae bacterium]|nr:HD domain-containing protein [Lachnospiraceae bacterium]
MSEPVLSQKKQNIAAFFLCIAAIALNLLLSALVSAFRLPIYLDTVGTVAIAAMGGYLPGVLVGFFTNLLRSLNDHTSWYYGVVSVGVALLTAGLFQRGKLKKLSGILLLILFSSLIGGSAAALIPFFMEGISFENGSLAAFLNDTGYFGPELSFFLSKYLTDIPDKALSVFLALGIIRFIPRKAYRYFSFGARLQGMLTEEEVFSEGRRHNRVISLRTKVFLVIGSFLVMVSVVAAGISMAVYRKTVIREHTRIARGTAMIAANILDGDRVEAYIREGRSAEGYAETEELLRKLIRSSMDISYVFAYRIEREGCRVVFDVEAEATMNGESCEEPGTLIDFDQSFLDRVPDLLEGREIEPVISRDRYGHLLTAYQPVFDSSGKCVCYTGADVDMGQLSAMERSFMTEMISVFAGFFAILSVFAIWLTSYHIVLPIRSITARLDRFSKGMDTQEDMDEDVKSLRKLRIHTGDEIEILYNAICRMTQNQAEQMRSIRRLSESTAKMQDGLIITMADMVENRDSDTGAHIQKTAGYVKIIAEALMKKGYYAEKITPKFVSDVVRSAPLHDIGKIHIPDGVLNKAGKLTDEEYEIMKSHTVSGKKIIEDAITTVEGENYLKEARNMAAYHHERWDGKGYPEGLHGEVIPLSARIMAIADVFDALTSPRIYKPAFSLEKALEIIEEGKGTQFDPKCVEAFMDSLAEVKVILRKYNKEG